MDNAERGLGDVEDNLQNRKQKKTGTSFKKKSPDRPDSKASCHKQTAAHNLETTL